VTRPRRHSLLSCLVHGCRIATWKLGLSLAVTVALTMPSAARAEARPEGTATSLPQTAAIAGKVSAAAAAPATYSLDTSITKLFREPAGSSATKYTDASGHWYIDWNFAQMCSDGSGAILMYYWMLQHPQNAYPWLTGDYANGWFVEPYNSTDWTYLNAHSHPTFQDSQKRTYWVWSSGGYYARGYMVYLSMKINPGGTWRFNGLDDYHSRLYGAPTNPDNTPKYPQWGSDPDYMTYALGWEVSGHSQSQGSWWTFHLHTDSNLAANLHQAVTTDLFTFNVPVQARVNAKYLVNWPSTSNLGHAVAIVGYNDSAQPPTYTFIDTYGPHAGVYTQSQSQMVQGMQTMPASPPGSPADGGYIW
jgi:hypothetical protein